MEVLVYELWGGMRTYVKRRRAQMQQQQVMMVQEYVILRQFNLYLPLPFFLFYFLLLWCYCFVFCVFVRCAAGLPQGDDWPAHRGSTTFKSPGSARDHRSPDDVNPKLGWMVLLGVETG